jgi:hypothetical protein
MKISAAEYLKSWIPYKALFDGKDLLFRWLYTGSQPYTDPFFDETISKCLSDRINSKPFRCLSRAELLGEWSSDVEGLLPEALIFHVSRCGSTLFSQSLGILPEHISLSEVPVFDEILRLCFKEEFDEEQISSMLMAAIKFYSAKRIGNESKLFIKMDSWHLMFYDRLRALFPVTPFIFLYRNPQEVLHSHRRKRGRQSVYGLIEPQLFGLNNLADKQRHPDEFMQFVLNRYFEKIIEIAGKDKQALLLNYNEGVADWMKKTGNFINMPVGAAYQQAIAERAVYNAKYPGDKFKEVIPEATIDNPGIQYLMDLYRQADKLRLQSRPKN